MAKDLGKQTVTVSKQERTWRVEIFCDLGNNPVINFHRQVVLDDGTKKVADPTEYRVITRTAKELSEMSVTVAKNTYTGAELGAVISAFGDALADDQDAKDEVGRKAAAEAAAKLKG